MPNKLLLLKNPQDAQCPFACIMSEGHVGNENFRDLLDCMVEGGCIEQVLRHWSKKARPFL
jgi:hypothetical protein